MYTQLLLMFAIAKCKLVMEFTLLLFFWWFCFANINLGQFLAMQARSLRKSKQNIRNILHVLQFCPDE